MRASPQGGCYSKPDAHSSIFQKTAPCARPRRGDAIRIIFSHPRQEQMRLVWSGWHEWAGRVQVFSVISVQVIPAAFKVRTDHGLCIHGCRFASPSYLQPLRRGRLSLWIPINPSPIPLIAHFHENGADQAPTGRFVRETCDHACSVRLISQMRRSRPFVVRIKIR